MIHVVNEQPLLADLFGMPDPRDASLTCTNLRTMTGKRPVWADDEGSVFYFPWNTIRFLEVPPASLAGTVRPMLGTGEEGQGRAAPDPELEIDEEFLRRVRDA